MKPAAGDLKVWSVNPEHLDAGASWQEAKVVAYSMKDAIQLYVDAGGAARGAENYFRNFATGGGSLFAERNPNHRRGIYLGDREWHSVMFLEPKSRSIVEEASAEAQAAAATQEPPENYGEIVPRFYRATKIDEWKFKSPFGDRAWADQMVAEVRMRKSDRRGRLIDQTGIEFFATSKCWPGEIAHSNTTTLLGMVKREFQLYDMAHRAIVWEDWLEIEVSPRDHSDDPDAGKFSVGLELTYRVIKRGVDPRDGKAYTLTDSSYAGNVIPFPLPKAAGVVDRNPRTGKVVDNSTGRDWYHAREERDQFAYLPATPENRAALDDLIAKMHQLRDRLAGVLEQTVIAKQLAGVSGRLLGFKEEES